MRRQNKKHRKIKKHRSGPNFTAQHLLHHPGTIRQLIDSAQVQSGDTVVDIGAGKGGITFPLSLKARKVIAVEIDADFVQMLKAKAQDSPHIKVLHCDFRAMKLPANPFCVVANIPFSITTAILEKLLGPEGKAFQRGAFILEQGAAKRFTQPAALDPRLLAWRMHFEFEMGTAVPKHHFSPPPRVDAAMIRISRRSQPLVPFRESKRFAAFAAYALRQPQLTAADALRGIFTPAQLKTAFRTAGIERMQIIAVLSLEQWAVLFLTMLQHVPHYRWPRR
ncbi:23S ribosomal RNA methyltransferase Erm [Paenibacillus senegalensis]|uniref:23S ribosomal RNA methyltransferase Erm n=1 Tax=Paenibacillus senegalensis TaxID=1465766 RepID=UPI0002894805|nr:23S ribosomal RNA methyltransferase Erm [Paenibacillus senegalensis]